jgi:1-acyl-sn-glycerol-3-phosphate acyltransferase
MKIKITNKSYDDILAMKKKKSVRPKRPSILFRTLLKIVSAPDLKSVNFRCDKVGMEKLDKKEPALFLMNHSSFVDLEIVSSLLFPRPFNIIATSDAFIGKNLLMRLIGCIPTNKFVTDTALVRNSLHAVKKLKSSLVLFPEAGYSFDGTATTLPDTLGSYIKMLGVPVVMIQTFGAFSRDPLYNNLQKRKVDVSATEKFLLSKEEVAALSPAEITAKINEEFAFDSFGWQRENHIRIAEPFRADYLNRVLYKCPACLAEGKTQGSGTELICEECGKKYYLDEYGCLKAVSGMTEFDHIPDWYSWERISVRAELLADQYSLDIPVDICIPVNNRRLYRVGEGRLRHSKDGFVLDGCDGKLHYEQKPLASYSLNSDFNWYEIGDVIGIGNAERLYYCFPKCEGDVVAKARLAQEELYKILKGKVKSTSTL